MSIIGKYNSIGNRRDLNLSDVDDKYTALSNLLNDLVTAENEQFIPDDIKAIEGLRNTEIDIENLNELIGQTVSYTDENRLVRAISPLVTIKDVVDNAKVITGDPAFLRGGDGPNAYFVESFGVLDQSNINATTAGDQLIANTAFKIGPFDFWDRGIFSFADRIYEDFRNEYGLVQWEGYIALIPTAFIHNFIVNSSGLFLVEVDYNDDGNWETLSSYYNPERTISDIGSISIGENDVVFESGITKFLGREDQVIAINGVDVTSQNIFIDDISDTNLNRVIFNTNMLGVLSSNDSITVSNELGSNQRSILSRFSIPNTFVDDKIKIRISVWWPVIGDPPQRYSNKFIVFSYGGQDEYLPYFYFYKEKPADVSPNPLSIEFYYKNSLTPWNKNSNESFTIDNSVLITYDPPVDSSSRYYGSMEIFRATKSQFSDTTSSGRFSGIEKGDYLCTLANGLGQLVQVDDVISTNSVTIFAESINDIPSNFENATNLTVEKFGYKGIVGLYQCSQVSTTQIQITSSQPFSAFSIDDIRLDYIVIIPGLPSYRIIDISGSTTLTITLEDLTGAATSIPVDPVLCGIYRDKGLEDRSKEVFCVGVFGERVNQLVTVGSNQITVDDTSRLSVGQNVQFDGFIPESTVITAINEATNTITLSNSVTQEIAVGLTITISPDNTNREVCVIALDTAPPFVGTATGLETAQGVEGIEANTLSIKEVKINLNQSQISAYTNQTSYSETLSFTSNGQNYKFLIL